MEKLEKMLDWLVDMDIKFYKTSQTHDYTPSGSSHFYIKGSLERFTSDEMIKIFYNQADDDLIERWHDAVADGVNHS